MAASAPLDAPCLVRAPIDPLRPSCGLQSLVAQLLPQRPDLIDRALVRELGYPLAALVVPVADDDVGVGVVRVGPALVDRRQP